MVKIFCDICGTEIKDSNEVIEINVAIPLTTIEAYECGDDYQLTQKHVCADCKSQFLNTFRKED